jgi:hypothetical protein
MTKMTTTITLTTPKPLQYVGTAVAVAATEVVKTAAAGLETRAMIASCAPARSSTCKFFFSSNNLLNTLIMFIYNRVCVFYHHHVPQANTTNEDDKGVSRSVNHVKVRCTTLY